MSSKDEYAKVARGKLKLKTDGELSKKKKKKKSKDKESLGNIDRETIQIKETGGRSLTKAEQSFKNMQDKMVKFEVQIVEFNIFVNIPEIGNIEFYIQTLIFLNTNKIESKKNISAKKKDPRKSFDYA